MKNLFFVLAFTGFHLYAVCQDRFQANWESLKKYQTPDWFRDAKFGIFIHWGVYSVPAFSNEWYPRNMYRTGTDEFNYHLKKYGRQDSFGYKDFIPLFKADKFDPKAWVQLFKNAGAKYVVPVAEHHDGFQMYRSALSKWNAFEMGPHRDVIGELAEETKKQGLVFGLSSHRIEHWFFMNGGRKINSDILSNQYNDFYGPAREENESPSMEYMNDWLLRDIELVEKYQPQLFWFDWWIEQPAMDPYRKSFASYYYNKGLDWKKGVVINYKNSSFPDQAAVLDLERGKLGGIRDLPWQTDDAIGNTSWGFAKGNTFKDASYVIKNLVDIVSKNGCLLLNIGPKSDGTITDEETQTLLGTGAWLHVNSEAIYNTRPWKIYGEGPTESAKGSFADQKVPFTAEDIRFTRSGNILYLITLGIPSKTIYCKSIAELLKSDQITKIELVGSSEPVQWSFENGKLKIIHSTKYPSMHAASYRIICNRLDP